MTSRHRLLLLSEMGFGWRIRGKIEEEQGAVQSLRRSLGAARVSHK